MSTFIHLFTQLLIRLGTSLEQAFLHLTQPVRYSIVLTTAADLKGSRAGLIAESALPREQLIILHRQVKKPSVSQSDRLPSS